MIDYSILHCLVEEWELNRAIFDSDE